MKKMLFGLMLFVYVSNSCAMDEIDENTIIEQTADQAPSFSPDHMSVVLEELFNSNTVSTNDNEIDQ